MVGKAFALELVLMRLGLRRLIIIAVFLAPNLVHAYDLIFIQSYFPSLFGQVSGFREDPDNPGAELFVLMLTDLRVYVARTENFAFGVEGGVSFVIDEDGDLKTVFSYAGFNISRSTIRMETGDVDYTWYLTVFPLYELDFLRFRYKAAFELGWYFLRIQLPNKPQNFVTEMNCSVYARMVFSERGVHVPDFGLTIAGRIHNNRLPRINTRRE
jgi:hypothetical protein